MLFKPDPSLPDVPHIPDTVPLCDFMFDEKYGRCPYFKSINAYTCGLTGRKISACEQKQRVERLSRAMAAELGWEVNQGSEFDKVVGIFATNTVSCSKAVAISHLYVLVRMIDECKVDIMGVSWAIHSLNGISSPANAAYSANELKYHLKTSQCKALFTVKSLLPIALEATDAVGIPRNLVFICETPLDSTSSISMKTGFKTLTQLIRQADDCPELEPIHWTKGQGERQTAYLSYSSGTSGLPKAVMITHKNIIANILQLSAFDQNDREKVSTDHRDIGLGLLPQSHIFSLIIICHASTYRGDSVIVLPKFDLDTYLRTIERFKINTLYLVPPIVIAMVNNFDKMSRFDLSSVHRVWVGAAPLGSEVTSALLEKYPAWSLTLGYGMTETCVVVTSGTPRDIVIGSSGWLLPGFEMLLIDETGVRITGYNQPGEVLLKSPSVVLGYMNNEKANRDTFVELPEGRFIKTGDVGEMRKALSGKEHLWIVDRIKELIKVKGHQVAPAELEACLLGHPGVADCAVIGIPDDRAGEVPKAFVVTSAKCTEQELHEYVQSNKTHHKWLKGGIEFVDSIPKSPSGKILRRILRDRQQNQSKAKL